MERTDLQILNGVKKRDVKTYEYLISKYGKQVFYIAHNILSGCGSREDAEECAADVFWKAWETIDSYDPTRGSFKTWLFIVTKYTALEYRRKLLRRQNIIIDDSRIEQMECNADVEKCIIGREEQEKLFGVINSFSGVDRELFVRRYFFGEKISDLADSMHLTRSAVDNRLLRGRKVLKEALSYE